MTEINLNVDDVVFCRVKKIEGTTVFLEVEGGIQGTMVLSEVAAGRIRNLRQYVTPNRKVVCKVLKVAPDHVEMSLRRVTSKEKSIVLEEQKKERALTNMLKLVNEDPKQIIPKIKETSTITDFLEDSIENPKVLEKYLPKEKAQKIHKIISEKEAKEKTIERKITLSSLSESGVNDIKEILSTKDVEIKYLGSSKFSVSVSAKDFKEAEQKLSNALDEIKKRAEQKSAILEIQRDK